MISIPNTEVVLGVMVAVTACAVIWAVADALAPNSPLAKRARRIAGAARTGRSGASSRERAEPVTLKMVLRRLAKRFEGLRKHAGTEAAEKLIRAGWRSRDASVLFVCARIVSPFVCGGVALVVFNWLELVTLDPLMQRVAPVAAVAIGGLLPGYIVNKKIAAREKKIRQSLPDALDLLVVCAEAGLSLDFALQRVAHEMEETTIEMADELRLTSAERRLLPERRKALENLANRCQIEPIKAVVQTLLQAEEYGTPLSVSLRVLANEMRSERMLKAEEKAAKVPVKMTVPLVVFIMPALFVVLIGPGILKTLDSLTSM